MSKTKGEKRLKNDVSITAEKTDGKAEIKATFAKFRNPKFSTAYIAKMAILTAIAFILYAFAKFNLPFMFPSFLEIQISELPALLAGFSMGPISGCLVVIIKCLLKFPLTTTAYVGESTDILLGIAFVLPASLIYYFHKDKKHALIGLCVGSACLTGLSILVNRFISIPFFVQLYFGGNFDAIVGVLKPLYKNVTIDTFYTYYLLLGVLPFNLFRCIIVSGLTFVLYKRLSKILQIYTCCVSFLFKRRQERNRLSPRRSLESTSRQLRALSQKRQQSGNQRQHSNKKL